MLAGEAAAPGRPSVEEIKRVAKQRLAESGDLAKLQAQLQAHVTAAILGDPAHGVPSPPLDKDAQLLSALVRDFLVSHVNCEHAAGVFAQEAGLAALPVRGEELVEELPPAAQRRLSSSAPKAPSLLGAIVADWIAMAAAGTSPVPRSSPLLPAAAGRGDADAARGAAAAAAAPAPPQADRGGGGLGRLPAAAAGEEESDVSADYSEPVASPVASPGPPLQPAGEFDARRRSSRGSDSTEDDEYSSTVRARKQQAASPLHSSPTHSPPHSPARRVEQRLGASPAGVSPVAASPVAGATVSTDADVDVEDSDEDAF
eukprot:TRINITY_DN34093_c0_g1_i1.p1 TRINITY_DN34093_c0_g1~~TRINITY_DN34093_c0_g1_i1.p1  ORF type:complete len:339 (+),score=83.97 TRINITY_DN34093_c0_g1_i1:73-1017(+)